MHTQTALTEPASSLEQAPTSKLSPSSSDIMSHYGNSDSTPPQIWTYLSDYLHFKTNPPSCVRNKKSRGAYIFIDWSFVDGWNYGCASHTLTRARTHATKFSAREQHTTIISADWYDLWKFAFHGQSSGVRQLLMKRVFFAACVGWSENNTQNPSCTMLHTIAWSSPVARCQPHHYLNCLGHKVSVPLPFVSFDPE